MVLVFGFDIRPIINFFYIIPPIVLILLAVNVALAYSGYKLVVLNGELHSAIIIMTFVSTFISPVVFARMVKADKNIMKK